MKEADDVNLSIVSNTVANPVSLVGRRFIAGGIAVESVRVRPDAELTNHDHERVLICSVIEWEFDEQNGHAGVAASEHRAAAHREHDHK